MTGPAPRATPPTATHGRARVRVCAGGLSTAQARTLRGSTDTETGALVVSAPTRSGNAALATGVLDALGATGSLRLVGRVPDAAIDVVLPWLVAYRVRHVLVTRIDRMPTTSLTLLLDLVGAAGAVLWVTGVPLSTPHRQVLAGRGSRELEPDTFCDAWTQAAAPPPGVAEVGPTSAEDAEAFWPPMPPDDFPTFRAALHRTVPAPAREQADTLFLATLVEARERLRSLLTGEAPGVRAASNERSGVVQLDRAALEEHVSHYLHHLLAVSPSTAGLTVRVRAAQVAAFRLGWLLSVNLPRLVATADEPSVATRRNPHTWLALRLFRYPYQGATCVLAGLDLDSDTIQTLPTSAVAADGSTVTIDGDIFAVPAPARVMLHAQHLTNQLAGRSADEPFVYVPGGTVTHERVRNTVRAALLDVGVPLLSRKVDSTWAANDWLNRWGVALQEVS